MCVCVCVCVCVFVCVCVCNLYINIHLYLYLSTNTVERRLRQGALRRRLRRGRTSEGRSYGRPGNQFFFFRVQGLGITNEAIGRAGGGRLG